MYPNPPARDHLIHLYFREIANKPPLALRVGLKCLSSRVSWVTYR